MGVSPKLLPYYASLWENFAPESWQYTFIQLLMVVSDAQYAVHGSPRRPWRNLPPAPARGPLLCRSTVHGRHRGFGARPGPLSVRNHRQPHGRAPAGKHGRPRQSWRAQTRPDELDAPARIAARIRPHRWQPPFNNDTERVSIIMNGRSARCPR